MSRSRQVARSLLICLVVVAGITAVATPAAADHDETDNDDDDSTITVNVDVGKIVDAIEQLADDLTDFTGNFSAIVTTILFQTFFQPFLDLLQAVAALVLELMVWLPDTTIPEVLKIHWQVYQVALLLGTAAVTVIGIIYMGYDPFGIPYSRVRPLLPRLMAALAFGAVAPWLLQYPVDLAEAVARALAPTDPSFTGLLMLSGELIVVSVVEAFVLLAVLIVFVVQKIYLLFAVAASPLIAVMWALPYTRRYASPLIGAFYGFLMISWLDVIVFRLTVALLAVGSFDVGTWVAGLGGAFLLLGVPYIVLSAGMSAAGPALAFASGAAASAAGRYRSNTDTGMDEDIDLDTPRRRDGNRARDRSGSWRDRR